MNTRSRSMTRRSPTFPKKLDKDRDKNTTRESFLKETAQKSRNQPDKDDDDYIIFEEVEKMEAVKAGKSAANTPIKKKQNDSKKKEENKKTAMEKYFDTNDTETEYEESDNESDIKTNKEVALQAMNDSEVTKFKGEMIALANAPDLGKRRKPETEKAMRAIAYIKILEQRTTRLPRKVSREINKALEVITNSLIELEANIHHAEAKLETMVCTQGPKQLLSLIDEPRQQTSKEEGKNQTMQSRKPPASFAEAVKMATSTIIIKAKEDRTAQEVERQVQEITTGLHSKVKRVQRIRNGLKIECEGAKEAQEIKNAIKENEEKSDDLQVLDADVRKKKIIILNIPRIVTENQIKEKLQKTLNVESQEYREDLIQINKTIVARNGMMHAPISLPEALANHLIQRKAVCLGFKECPIKNYVTVLRCHKCLGFDHLAAQCRGTQKCSTCAGDHSFKDCKKTTEKCTACAEYNAYNRGRLKAPKNENHKTHSSSCWVYNTIMSIRQLELEEGKKILTQGIEVVKGRIAVQKWEGRISIVQNRDLQMERQQRNTRYRR